jgi:tetratricopeptide (TPR) repeat protein
MLFIPLAHAQKPQIKAAQKALKAGNSEQIIAILSPVEYLINNASNEDKINFYYLKGTALVDLANKKVNTSKSLSQAVIAFNDLIEIEKESNNVKYTSEAIESLKKIKVGLIDSANEDLAVENFAESSKKFHQAYLIDKKDTLQLYNAALSYKYARENNLAIKCYEELKAINYSGHIPVYIAYSIDKLKDEYFSTIEERNAKIKIGSHIRPREEFQSKKGEIYRSIAMIYIQTGYKEKAIKAISAARSLDSQSLPLALIEANLYLQTKDYDYFDNLVSVIIESKPNNAQLLTYFGGNCHIEKYYSGAEYYYKKAIETDPKYAQAYVGLLALLVEKSRKITEQMNELGSSTADKKAFSELKTQKEQIAKEVFPYVQKVVSIDPFNSSVQQLINCMNTADANNLPRAVVTDEKTIYTIDEGYMSNQIVSK